MSFIARDKRGDRTYLYEVESYREGNKVKRRKLGYVGVEIKTETGVEVIPAHKDVIDRLELHDDVSMGDVTALYSLVQELGVADVIDRFSIKGGGFPAGSQLMLMAINHAIHPVATSRLGYWVSGTTLPSLTGIEPQLLNKDNLGSAMDGICREVESLDGEVRLVDNTLDICKALTEIWSKAYCIPLDALYYDITSTYFEGVKCILAKYGYSRDKKVGKKQINVALVVTRKYHFPLFFKVYEGNTLDQDTVSDVLKILKEGFNITRCTLVWDRGMATEKNIRRADRARHKLICGLIGSECAVRDIILSVPDEDILKKKNQVRDLDNGDAIYAMARETSIYGKKRNIVVYINTQIQRDSRQKRETKLRRARAKLGIYRCKLENGHYTKMDKVVSHVKECVKGVSKYFEPEYKIEDGRISIDWAWKKDKLEEAVRLDGKFAIMSSDLQLKSQDIIDAYFEKDGIERAFRYMKQITDLHPTRCRLENRVKVHVLICFLAYLLLKAMEYKLHKNGIKMTAERALEELGRIRHGMLMDPTTQYRAFKVSRLSETQRRLVECLGISGYINSER
nr:IS1634 family transposase [Thermoplasmata archaeon]